MAATIALTPSAALPWLGLLLDVSLKALVILLLAGLAAGLLRRRSAAVRHMVWTAGLVASLCLPALSLALPRWQVRLLPPWAQPPAPVAAAPAPRMEVAPAEGPAQPLEALRPAIEPLAPARPPMVPAGPPLPSAEPAPLAAAAPVPPPDPAPAGTAGVHWSAWVLLAWLAGAVVLLSPLLVGTLTLRRRRRRARPIVDGDWPELLPSLRRSLGLRAPVALLRSEWATVPLTFGVLRPVVMLPVCADVWPEDRRRVVLLHELAHVRRRDCLTQLLARLARVVYWFNPLVWLAGRQLRVERERACDDLVLAAGHRASDYASHLLEIVSTLRSARCPSLAAVAMGRRSQFEGRLLAILDGTRNRRALTRLTALAVLALVAAIAVPLAALGPAEPEAATPAAQPSTALDQSTSDRTGEGAAGPEGPLETLEAFLAAVVAGEVRDAMRMTDPASAIPQQFDDFREIPNLAGLTIARAHGDGSSVVAATSAFEFERRGERYAGLLVFTLIRSRGVWIVSDIDLETPDSAEEEFERFLQAHPNAEELVRPAPAGNGASATGPAAGMPARSFDTQAAPRETRARDAEARAAFLAVERIARMPADRQAAEMPRLYRELAPRYMSPWVELALSSYPEDILGRGIAPSGDDHHERWAGQLAAAAAEMTSEQVADALEPQRRLDLAGRARALQVMRAHPAAVDALIREDLESGNVESVGRASTTIWSLDLRAHTDALLSIVLARGAGSAAAERALLFMRDPAIVQDLLQRVEQDPSLLERYAGLLQGPLWRQPAPPVLLRLLESDDADVRYHAARAVYECRDARLAPAVVRLAVEPDGRIRVAAAYLAGNLPEDAFRGVRDDLLPLLHDPDDPVRLQAVRCFAERKDLAAAPVLLDFLRGTHSGPSGQREVTVMQSVAALTGDTFGYDMHNWGPAGPGNARAIERLEAWVRAASAGPEAPTQPVSQPAGRNALQPAVAGSARSAQRRVRTEIANLDTALDVFQIDCGRYPTAEEGLAALIQAPPNLAGWNGPYIRADSVPKDPWGSPYQYRRPSHRDPSRYDLYSAGPDGQPGTSDDLGNWPQALPADQPASEPARRNAQETAAAFLAAVRAGEEDRAAALAADAEAVRPAVAGLREAIGQHRPALWQAHFGSQVLCVFWPAVTAAGPIPGVSGGAGTGYLAVRVGGSDRDGWAVEGVELLAPEALPRAVEAFGRTAGVMQSLVVPLPASLDEILASLPVLTEADLPPGRPQVRVEFRAIRPDGVPLRCEAYAAADRRSALWLRSGEEGVPVWIAAGGELAAFDAVERTVHVLRAQGAPRAALGMDGEDVQFQFGMKDDPRDPAVRIDAASILRQLRDPAMAYADGAITVTGRTPSDKDAAMRLALPAEPGGPYRMIDLAMRESGRPTMMVAVNLSAVNENAYRLPASLEGMPPYGRVERAPRPTSPEEAGRYLGTLLGAATRSISLSVEPHETSEQRAGLEREFGRPVDWEALDAFNRHAAGLVRPPLPQTQPVE